MSTSLDTESGVFTQQRRTRDRRLWRLGTVVAATLLAVVVWFVAVPVAGLELIVGADPVARTVGLDDIVLAALALSLAAWALLALLERLGVRGRRCWQVIGWLALVGSLFGPVIMGATPTVLMALLAMHVVVGGTVIVGLAHPRTDA